MSNWEYAVEVVKVEYGDAGGWSVHNSEYGHLKLQKKLNDYGKFGWELVSIMPILYKEGTPASPDMLYAIFKKPKE